MITHRTGPLKNLLSQTVSYTKDNLFGDEGMQAFAAAACEGALPSLRLMYIYGALARHCHWH